MRNPRNLRTAVLIALVAVTVLALAPAAHAAGKDAVTLWWVVFNNPGACDAGCDGADLENPDVQGSVVYSSGDVTGRAGRVRLVGSITETRAGFKDDLIGGPGLLDADRAEIHMVVRSHGPRVRAIELEQITQFLDSGCSDLGGPNECRDIQFAIHLPGDAHSESEVFWFPDLNDGAAVPGASSDLFRQSGGLRVVLDTRAD